MILSSKQKIFLAFLSGIIFLANVTNARSADLMNFWREQRNGANSFNKNPPDYSYFRALSATGATWVRLTFSKWHTESRDFLLGNADNYRGLVEQDMQILLRTIDAAEAAGLKVVIVPLSLPGARWIQQNAGQFDDRLWSKPEYSDQAVRFWRELAGRLKNHRAIAAYNLINEPAPEKITGLEENASIKKIENWQIDHSGGSRDLYRLYTRIISAIRQVDPVTPIMVDSGYYANARSLAAWSKPLSDDKVLYAFHMYEPYEATSAPNMRRKLSLRYPGTVTRYASSTITWNRNTLAAHIGLPFVWAARNGVDTSHIVMAEYGCMRLWPDCRSYLADVLEASDKYHAHRAFYAFREDEWDGMDYELPSSLRPGLFYWLAEQGMEGKLPRNGALMKFLKQHM